MDSGPHCKALESSLSQSKFISNLAANQASHELFSPTLLHQAKGGLLYQQQPMQQPQQQQQHGFLGHSNDYQETYYLAEGVESAGANSDVYSACAPHSISEASVGNIESQQQPAYNYNREDAWSANLHGPFDQSYDNQSVKGVQQDFNNNSQQHQQQSGEQYQPSEASSYSSAQATGHIQPHVHHQRLIQGQPFANNNGFYATQTSYECSNQQQFCANNNNNYQSPQQHQQQQQQYQQHSGSPTLPLEQVAPVDNANLHSSQQQHDQVDQQHSPFEQCSSRNSNNTVYALNSSGMHDYRPHQQTCQSSSNSQYQDDFNHQTNYASSGSNSGCSSSTQYNLNNNFSGLSNMQQSVSSEKCFLSDHYEITTSPARDTLSQSNTIMCANKARLIKSRRGRPRKKGLRSKNKVNGKLWEFIRDLLLSERTNPSFIRWERREDGVFKFVQSDKVAKMWGERKQNPKMTYEKLSRAMRYYYKSKVLLPVFGRRLVYKFGPNATGWLPNE